MAKTFVDLNDHLGSARVVIDSAGTVADKSYYLAFGSADVGSSSSTGQDMKYTGKEWDGEGGMSLYYYGARYYDPTLGRFTQVDQTVGLPPHSLRSYHANDANLKHHPLPRP
ncbi:MAG: RHS repeat-associated core domain-containing protein [Candidatus Zixiibacteriota bacterium]